MMPAFTVLHTSPFFVFYSSMTKSTGAAVINRVVLGRAASKDKMYILSQARLVSGSCFTSTRPQLPLALFPAESGRRSNQDIRRPFTDRMRTQAMTKLRGKDLSVPSL